MQVHTHIRIYNIKIFIKREKEIYFFSYVFKCTSFDDTYFREAKVEKKISLQQFTLTSRHSFYTYIAIQNSRVALVFE